MTQHHEHDLPAAPPPAELAGAIAGGLASDTVLQFDSEPLTPYLGSDVSIPGGGQVYAAPRNDSGFDEIPAESLEAAVQEPVAAEEQDEVDNAQGLGYLTPSLTTQQDHEVFFPLEGSWNDAGVFMVGQADTQERTTQALDLLPNLDLTATDSGRDWVDYMRESINIAPNKDQWRATADRLGSTWRQQVDSQRGQIKMGALSFSNVSGEKLTGEKAVIQVRALTGLGSVIQVPLWHSGFHVTVKAPGEPEMLELNRRLTDEKVVIGRTTNGLAFANTSSYMSQTLLDFVMDYIYDTSLQEKDKGRIRAQIEAPDLPILFWGLACAVWPRGFQYARPYIDPITKQEKMLREKLAVGKLMWVDTKSLTARQISHMANRGSGQMSLDTVKRYKEEFTIGEPRRIKLSEHISMTLHVPTADEYVLAGAKWIGDIMQTADEAFALSPEDNRRANYIVNKGKATAMRQYSHWVKEIHVGHAVIEDRETIDNTLASLSGDDALRNLYFEEIQKYIDDVTMAIIATPTATQAEEKTFPKFPHLLPLNVEHTFFTLLEQKVTQISQRN